MNRFTDMAREAQQGQGSLFTEQEVLEQHREEERALRRARLLDSGVRRVLLPEAADLIERDMPRLTHALQCVQDFYHRHNAGEHRANILALMGLTGRGKTFAGGWLLARPPRLYRGRPLGNDVRVYCTAERLRHAHQSQWQEFERICRARITVVDELGSEGGPAIRGKASLAAQNALRDFITLRTGDELLLTALLTNNAEVKLRARYDASTIGRIDERARWYVAGGDDLRVPLARKP